MADPLHRAIVTMMVALNAKPDPERVQSFVDAIDDMDVCRSCAAIAARKLTAYLGRRPWPKDLCIEARDLMGEQEHERHLTGRALGAGDGLAWWTHEGRAIVEGVWPDCPSLGWVVDQLRRFGYVEMTGPAIMAEVGLAGTPERAWWVRHIDANVEPAP